MFQSNNKNKCDNEVNDEVADAVAPILSISDTEPHGVVVDMFVVVAIDLTR